ncbi:substrate-binding domain-containing protein [Bifidobacterium oedipodis]|uniref:DeoR family transcriptional regulator n=1 Tax=Bifidobacterium oedipodis TaxID=2675322 RepID=A0A7Y0HS71_9BIFI|nr:substrate-binding domain-containing protein [Bifidobacterium sp. DSM 109957]NMM93691.1 DeoR family transcriptional regulator [Bifidobacterium sp. DSM 109957]
MTENTANGEHRDYLPAERQDMILSLLTRQSVATVAELADLLHTTDITVRRDLTVLAKAGLLKRVRGGAMSVASSDTDSPDATASRGQDSTETSIAGGLISSSRPRLHPELGADQPAIGIMLPEPSFFWPRVIDCMRESAAKQGMRIVTRESSYDEGTREDEILDELAADPTVCGIIAAPNAHHKTGERTWDWIMNSSIPVVAMERSQPILAGHTVDSVRTNHHYGVRKAAVHFLEHGHTRIGAAFSETPTAAQIQEGWNLVLDGTDRIDCPFQFNGIPPYSTSGVNEVVDRIIESGATAMLIHSDYLAIAVAQQLERRGKHVPDDVSIISIDGFATPSSRPLTVLRSPAKELADSAICAILNRIQFPEFATRQVFVDPVLVDRGSVAQI